MRLPLSTRRLRTPLLASVCVAVLAAGTVSATANTHRIEPRAGAAANGAPGAPATPKPSPAELKAIAGPVDVNSSVANLPASGSYAFLLELNVKPTMTAYASAGPLGKVAAHVAAIKQLRAVKAAQSAVIGHLPAGSHVEYTMQNVLPAVVVESNVQNFRALQQLAGVRKVAPIAPKTLSNFYAVPQQGGATAWQNTGNLGQGSTIAVIDSGIDYTHADFGGAGTTAAYDAAKASDTSLPATGFPSAKIAGGYDLAGDNYDALSSDPTVSTPQPDGNPLDCNGHGTHVAGTAAGYGENADGSTYTGSYDSSTPFDTMKIGPGMAPQAKLYAYKVFGCSGGTSLISEAIDRAADPNGDGDTSDHVNVINISIVSDYGSPDDGDSLAADAASQLGITVVAAAGNGGDHPDVGGSPGNAPSAIAVAASTGASRVANAGYLYLSGPAGGVTIGTLRSAGYDWATKPDLAGTLATLPSYSRNQSGCGYISGTDANAISGKVAVLQWSPTLCSARAVASNVRSAHALGAILVNADDTYRPVDGGSSIPVVLIGNTDGQSLLQQLQQLHPDQVVTVDHTTGTGFSPPLDTGGDDQLISATSRGIRDAGNVKPDVSAVGSNVFSTGMATGNDGVSMSGTSMAAPMVAGLAALVHTAHPGWTALMRKADIINTAAQDVYAQRDHQGTPYGPNRVGAGRIKADAAVANTTLAYVPNSLAVSVSFGTIEVTGPTSLTKTIKVDNTGDTPVSYDVAYQARTTIPGVDLSTSVSHIDLAAHASTTLDVTLSVQDPTLLTKPRDPNSASYDPYVAAASGVVELTPTAGAQAVLRIPVYSAPRPASTMTAASTLSPARGAAIQTPLSLNGSGVDQGREFTDGVSSKVAGFELQATSGPAPVCSDTVTELCIRDPEDGAEDLRYVGATSTVAADTVQGGGLSSTALAFAVSTYGTWRTPGARGQIQVFIDTDNDGNADFIAYTTVVAGTPAMAVYSVAAGRPVDVQPINRFYSEDTAEFDSDTMILPVNLSSLNISDAQHTYVHYGVRAVGPTGVVDVVGMGANDGLAIAKGLSIDAAKPGVAVTGTFEDFYDTLIYRDQPGTLTVTTNSTSYDADGGLGLLMVHLHNTVGSKAQVVSLSFPPKKTPTVTLVLPKSVRHGSVVSTTLKVTGGAGVSPTGDVNVTSLLPTPLNAGNLGRTTIPATFNRFTFTAPATPGTYYIRTSYSGDDLFQAARVIQTLIVT